MLVLDGIEPLQSSHAFDRGRLDDPALESLLRGLAIRSNGLCVITTREPLPNFAGMSGLRCCDLELLKPDAGKSLLRTAKVVGGSIELEDLARQFGLHALTISLLGVYLFEKDPSHGIGSAAALDPGRYKESVDCILEGFEGLLAPPELEILRLVGLFDRPADPRSLAALCADPPVPGLTERATRMTDAEWAHGLWQLAKLRLIQLRPTATGVTERTRWTVDAHPLVRSYFAGRLRAQPGAWREGHRRVYEQLKTSVAFRPNTLNELLPLYQAMAHGCEAGLHESVFAEVYFPRVLRREQSYSVKKLGAIGADLAAIASFFAQRWTRFPAALSPRTQICLLGEAASRLQALGRLREAIDPMAEATNQAVAAKKWDLAAANASNLSAVKLTLGRIASAIDDARMAIGFAERSNRKFRRVGRRAHLANALHVAGREQEAHVVFTEAEHIQQNVEPKYPLLHDVHGFRYCELLLAKVERSAWQEFLQADDSRDSSGLLQECDVVAERVDAAFRLRLDPARAKHDSIHYIALDNLTRGRIALYRAVLDRPFRSQAWLKAARSAVSMSLEHLRSAGQQGELPRALLTRAWLNALEGDPTGARTDLDEAWAIAERSSMRLFMVDIHLNRARLLQDNAELAHARTLMEQCGYLRRAGELQDAESAQGTTVIRKKY